MAERINGEPSAAGREIRNEPSARAAAPMPPVPENQQPLLSTPPLESSGSVRAGEDGRLLGRTPSTTGLIVDIGSRLDSEPPLTGCPTVKQFAAEAQRNVIMTGPLICLYVFSFLQAIISEIFVGHLGSLELASSALAITFTNVTGHSLIVGFVAVMETLCGQAYGAGEFFQVGETLQRALVIVTTICVPISLLWYYTEPLLLLCGQEPAIAAAAGLYAKWNLPGLFFHAWSEPIEKYLQSQGLMVPMAACSCATLVLHVPICYLLIYVCGFGYLGAAMASSVSYLVTLLALLAYIAATGLQKRTWGGWSRACLRGWGPFFRLALPSAVMICLEWWCFEIVILLAGLLPNAEEQVSAMSIMLNTLLVCFMLPFSIGDATSTRVGNELGAGNAARARLACLTALLLALVVGLAMSILLLVFRRGVGRIFTGDAQPGVVEAVAGLAPFLSVTLWFDSVQSTASGALRGSGRQRIGAVVNILSWYIVALPVGAVAAFYFNLGVKGLWLGLVVGALVQDVSITTVALRTNWLHQAERSEKLVSEQTILSDQHKLALQ